MKIERTNGVMGPGHTIGDHVYLLGIKHNKCGLIGPLPLALSDESIDAFVIEKMMISRDDHVREGDKLNVAKTRILAGQLNKQWLVCKIKRVLFENPARFNNFVFSLDKRYETRLADGTVADPTPQTEKTLAAAGLYPGYLELGLGLNLLSYDAQEKNREKVVKAIVDQAREKYPELEIIQKRMIEGGPVFYAVTETRSVLSEEPLDPVIEEEVEPDTDDDDQLSSSQAIVEHFNRSTLQ